MIETLNDLGALWWSWAGPMLWQVALLALVIGAIDLVLSRRGWPQVRYALWLLVLIKLFIPPSFSLPSSLFAHILPVSKATVPLVASDMPTPAVVEFSPPIEYAPDYPAMPAVAVEPIESAALERSALSLQAWAMLLSGAVSLLLLGWLVVRARRLRRVAHADVGPGVAPPWLGDVLAESAAKLRLRRIPRLVVTDAVRCAAVCGVFRPTLLLPAAACKDSSRKRMGHILLHELAHIKRGDLIVNAAQTLVHILFWFHPAVWLVGRRLRHLRELCCDATVSKLLRERTYEYRDTLLAAARTMFFGKTEPGLGFLGLFENASRLRQRLQHLERPAWKHARLRLIISLAAVALMLACVVPMARGRAKQVEKPAEPVSAEKAPVVKDAREPSGGKATLSNGVTLELIGVSYNPSEGEPWWRPDGSPLAETPSNAVKDRLLPDEHSKAYEFVTRVTGVPGKEPAPTWQVIPGPSTLASFFRPYSEEGKPLNFTHWVAVFPKSQESFTLRVSMPTGPWVTRAIMTAPAGGGVRGGGLIVLSRPYEVDGQLAVTVSDNIVSRACRIVLVDVDGRTHKAKSSSGSRVGEIRQATFYFDKMPLEEVKEFRFQTRPYERVEFRNISLRPEPAVEVSPKPALEKSASSVESEAVAVAGRVVDEKAAAAEERVLDFRVIHRETKKPLAGVSLEILIDKSKSIKTTDEQGRYIIKLPTKEPNRITITARKQGFVPMEVSWLQSEQRVKIPNQYTLALEPGTSIGSIIRDEEGNPIKGATVYLIVGPTCRPVQGEVVAIYAHPIKTDAEGRWRCDIMPSKLDHVAVRLEHADYISDRVYGLTPKPPMERLRDMTGVMVMKKGLTVEGKVLNQEGQPVRDARVAQGASRFGSHYPVTKTDNEGHFRFINVPPGEMILTVQALGYAPDLKRIVARPGMPEVEFRLGPGYILRGRVVDSDAKPVAGAWVASDTWRGYRTLKLRASTDSEGRFEFRSSPADEIFFDMGKEGYMSIRRRGLSPSDEEYIITMNRPLKVRGKVLDAETGEPITKFNVMSGLHLGEERPPHWSKAGEFTDGRYEITFDEPRYSHLVRIEAEGYEPAISRPFKDDEGAQTFDFKLKKGTGPIGVVLLPDGTPLEGAKVALVRKGGHIQVTNGRLRRGSNMLTVETTPDGRFSFAPAPQIERYIIVVVHEEGYAEVTGEELSASPEVKVQRWGRVEGILRIGARPGANETVRLEVFRPASPEAPLVIHNFQTTTDAEGHFILERVLPGKGRVGRQITLRYGTTSMVSTSHGVPVEIRPGETAYVTIGGTGRPIVCRVVAPAETEREIDWTQSEGYLLQREIEVPKEVIEQGAEAARMWIKARLESKEDRPRVKSSYVFKLKTDGSFRLEDIPAGIFQLGVSLHEPTDAMRCGPGELLGEVSHYFVVPEMPGERSDEPLDIGTLELKLAKRVNVGDPAPLFEAKTLDGKVLRLEDYRGKFVLLDFWATWCGPCLAETPHLKATYQAFGSDERFVMIGLSLDKEVEAPKKYVAENDLKWIQGFLGEWSKTKVPDQYGVPGIPAIFLVGPDGRVIAKGLRGEEIKSAVERALRKPAG